MTLSRFGLKNSLKQRNARHDDEELSDPVPSVFPRAKNALSQKDFLASEPDQSDPVPCCFRGQRIALTRINFIKPEPDEEELAVEPFQASVNADLKKQCDAIIGELVRYDS